MNNDSSLALEPYHTYLRLFSCQILPTSASKGGKIHDPKNGLYKKVIHDSNKALTMKYVRLMVMPIAKS